MKRFTVLTAFFSISALTVWAFFQAAPVPKAKYDNAPIAVYDATGEMLKAIHAGDSAVPVTGAGIAQVYDITGATLESINLKGASVTIAPVYDSTGAMLNAINSKSASVVAYSNVLELQYAQPWLDAAGLPIVVTGNAQNQIPLNCHSSIEMLYACKYGYGHP